MKPVVIVLDLFQLDPPEQPLKELITAKLQDFYLRPSRLTRLRGLLSVLSLYLIPSPLKAVEVETISDLL